MSSLPNTKTHECSPLSLWPPVTSLLVIPLTSRRGSSPHIHEACPAMCLPGLSSISPPQRGRCQEKPPLPLPAPCLLLSSCMCLHRAYHYQREQSVCIQYIVNCLSPSLACKQCEGRTLSVLFTILSLASRPVPAT